MTTALDRLGVRIERVALDPDAIDNQLLFRVARPLLAVAGWRANVRFTAITALVSVLGDAARSKMDPSQARAALSAAVRELEENVSTIERAAIVRRRPPVAHAAWLRRVWESVKLAERAVCGLESGTPDEDVLRRAARPDAAALLPPIGLHARTKDDGAEPEPAAFVSAVATTGDVPSADADVRVVELELASIDHLLAAARAERTVLGRKRRLLVAARQRLLDASAALPLDHGARARAGYVAREISRIDRLEMVGLAVDVGLVHQARQAASRGDPRRLYAALAALDAGALASGDAATSRITSRAIAHLWGDAAPTSLQAIEASLQASAAELLGADVVRELEGGVEAGRAAAARRVTEATSFGDQQAAQEAVRQLEGADVEILRSSVAVDGCFEVGGALVPMRVVEEERVLRQVRYPTPELVLVAAHDAHDLPDAIVSDPRTILLDLAAGRMLARRFVREEVQRRTRVVARSEVRVYVLDGSGSMRGPRARVRDGLLVAEIATLIARLRSPGEVRCTLYFRYFDEELGPVTRIDGIQAARGAIGEIVGAVRSGGTDIQRALLASLTQIETARELDPELSRAQIVLVTDGEADVDEATILGARAAIQGLPIGVSVIALGEENAALRGLVARQRARGERAFYHHLDDRQLASIAEGTLDLGLPVHLPGDKAVGNPLALAKELESEIGPLVDELVSLDRARDVAALERLETEAQARREAGLDVERSAEGEGARLEAMRRDRTSLLARFARWFPEPEAGMPSTAAEGTKERDDVDATICALASVAEVLRLVGGSELARRADAIEMLERVLPDAQLSPARYRAVLRDRGGAVAPALRAIHDAVKPAPDAA